MKPISKIASNLLERKTIKEIANAIANTLTKTMVITMKTTTTTSGVGEQYAQERQNPT